MAPTPTLAFWSLHVSDKGNRCWTCNSPQPPMHCAGLLYGARKSLGQLTASAQEEASQFASVFDRNRRGFAQWGVGQASGQADDDYLLKHCLVVKLQYVRSGAEDGGGSHVQTHMDFHEEQDAVRASVEGALAHLQEEASRQFWALERQRDR
uniref:Uncharacterized protein n=1 Tax=Mycena chlorophos TaxID=658473 RepID=A0ABQ0LYR1_MYCCL|nr:predicted protein [Mycena chlorophos]